MNVASVLPGASPASIIIWSVQRNGKACLLSLQATAGRFALIAPLNLGGGGFVPLSYSLARTVTPKRLVRTFGLVTQVVRQKHGQGFDWKRSQRDFSGPGLLGSCLGAGISTCKSSKAADFLEVCFESPQASKNLVTVHYHSCFLIPRTFMSFPCGFLQSPWQTAKSSRRKAESALFRRILQLFFCRGRCMFLQENPFFCRLLWEAKNHER